MIYRFNEYEMDTGNFQLSRHGRQIDLEPKVFDLLRYLVANRKKLVTRDELFANLWPGQVVSDTSLSNQIKSARKALGDSGQTQSCIKTVRGRGYQFIAPAEEIPEIAEPDKQLQVSPEADARSRGPIVAVLPFQNLSSDPEQDYFCEGISEDITTELSRFSDIQVIARHSAFQFGNADEDVEEIARKLGTDYIVEGSVRRAGNQVRLNAQLIDTANRDHVWADRYDFALQQIFEVQDQIIETVVSTMTGQIRKIEMDRAMARSTENLSAYEHLLRGLYYHKSYWPTREDYAKAHAEFTRAIELDPRLARAHAWSVCSLSGVRDYYTREILEEYLEICKYALRLDPGESEIHRLLGGCYFSLGEFELGKHHIDLGRQLNPNDSHIIAKSSLYYIFLGEFDLSREMVERAMRLNPLHPGWYWLHLGMIDYFNGKYLSAIEQIRKNSEQSAYDLIWLAACYAASGDDERARDTVARAFEIDDRLSIAKYTQWDSFKNSAHLEQVRMHMAAAGVPN